MNLKTIFFTCRTNLLKLAFVLNRFNINCWLWTLIALWYLIFNIKSSQLLAMNIGTIFLSHEQQIQKNTIQIRNLNRNVTNCFPQCGANCKSYNTTVINNSTSNFTFKYQMHFSNGMCTQAVIWLIASMKNLSYCVMIRRIEGVKHHSLSISLWVNSRFRDKMNSYLIKHNQAS